MKDHELAKLTNDLRDIAIKYGHTEQLREQIAHRLHPEIIRLRAELAASKELNKKLQSLVDAGLLVNSTSEARHRRELAAKTQECEELRRDAERWFDEAIRKLED